MTYEQWQQEVEAIVQRDYGLTPEQCETRGVSLSDFFDPEDYDDWEDFDDWDHADADDAAAEMMSALLELERVEGD